MGVLDLLVVAGRRVGGIGGSEPSLCSPRDCVLPLNDGRHKRRIDHLPLFTSATFGFVPAAQLLDRDCRRRPYRYTNRCGACSDEEIDVHNDILTSIRIEYCRLGDA